MATERIAALFLAFALSPGPRAQSPGVVTSAPKQLSASEIGAAVTPALVAIRGISTEGKEIGGSGFLVDQDGTIITNLHVVSNLKTGGVRLHNGDVYDSFKIVAFDERKDLAVIRVAGFSLPFLELGDSDKLKIGESVVLMGSPFGLDASLSTGVVSAIRQSNYGYRVIQTDAAANPGNSGGPLLNPAGQVVGVLTFKVGGAENLNFAVPINYARGMLGATGTPFTLSELRQKIDNTTLAFGPAATSKMPSRWRSLASNSIRTLRFDGDYLYSEVHLPEDARSRGDFTLTELKKTATGYTGITKGRYSCSWFNRANIETVNVCPYETAMELTAISASRIEGWTMAPDPTAKFDCKKCQFSKPDQRRSFSWIPE